MNIGIIGSGQLARMLALAGKPMGLNFSFLAEVEDDVSSVTGLGRIVTNSPGMSVESLYESLDKPDVITIEKEQVSLALLKELERFCPVYPTPSAIGVSQNRIHEKDFLRDTGLPTAPFFVVNNRRQLVDAARGLKFPLFIKHPLLGYDGKNQWKVNSWHEYGELDFKDEDFPLLFEQGVPYLFEASIFGARSVNGEVAIYPATKNWHVDGILLGSYAGEHADFNQHLIPAAHYLNLLFDIWDYVGVMAIELFVTPTGLIINEIAPRVHNSGHWTMDGCKTSQFENHLRAITGMPLGKTDIHGYAGMVNLLGIPDIPLGLDKRDVVHLYNKAPKPKRKLGHINFLADDEISLLSKQQYLIELLYGVSPDIHGQALDQLPKKEQR